MLLALRAQHEAMGAQIEALLIICMDLEEEQPTGCQHPTDQRIDMSTMGVDRWQCKLCGHQHEEVINK